MKPIVMRPSNEKIAHILKRIRVKERQVPEPAQQPVAKLMAG